MFNLSEAEAHLEGWPHPAGMSAWELGKDLSKTERPDGSAGLYDAVWPALRASYAKYYSIYEPSQVKTILYRQYRFHHEYGKYPYRWIFWREPDVLEGMDANGDRDPKSFIHWFPERFNELDYELYTDGVHTLSREGQGRSSRNRKHIVDRLKAQFRERKQGRDPGPFRLPGWDYLKGCPDESGEEVPF